MLNEVRNFQQVTCLCVHRTNELFNEIWCIVNLLFIFRKVCPCWINSKFFVLTTTINSSVVHINDIFTLLTVRLNDELLHLLNSEIYRDNTCNTEECRLEDSVSTVTQTDFLTNLASVNIVNLDIILCEISLNVVRDEVNQLLAIEDSIQQECTVFTETTSNIVHVQVSLNVTCNEVRGIYQVSRVDWLITETEVRTCETTRLLRVV